MSVTELGIYRYEETWVDAFGTEHKPSETSIIRVNAGFVTTAPIISDTNSGLNNESFRKICMLNQDDGANFNGDVGIGIAPTTKLSVSGGPIWLNNSIYHGDL